MLTRRAAEAIAARGAAAAAALLPLRPSSSSAAAAARPALPDDGLTLSDFVRRGAGGAERPLDAPSAAAARPLPGARSVFIETYGCAMNTADSEIVGSVLRAAGFAPAPSATAADVVLVNTCAIRDNAEAKIWARLGYFKNLKANRAAGRGRAGPDGRSLSRPGPVVGVLGCMAERLKHRLLESDRLVDLVAGPDAYRDLPRLIAIVEGGGGGEALPQFEDGSGGSSPSDPDAAPVPGPPSRRTAINVQLSADETYADVIPVRPAGSRAAYLSIMRGCNNMCAFCVVPFTRGRERSRPLASIVDEVRMLSEQGVREVTLLGQNVNSYADRSHLEPHPPPPPSFAPAPSPGAATAALQPQLDPSAPSTFEAHYARGFRSVYVPRRAGAARFADLLHAVAAVDPELRVRFTSPHPKDFSDDVLSAIAAHPNVCTQLHMPAQSGSSAVLERMRRGYSREAYDELVAHVRAVLPGVALSTDMIAGFCGEGEADHAASVDLLASTGFDAAFLFAYSERERTHAARRHADDVPPGVKSRRLGELVAAHRAALHARAAAEVGRRHVILVEGPSRKAPQMLTGLTDTNKRVVIEDGAVPPAYSHAAHQHQDAEATAHSSGVRLRPGDYAAVEVTAATGATLHARVLARTTLAEFVLVHGSAAPLGLHGGR